MEPQVRLMHPLPRERVDGEEPEVLGTGSQGRGPTGHRAAGSGQALSPGSGRDPGPWVQGQPWLLWPRAHLQERQGLLPLDHGGAPVLHQLRLRAAGQPGVSPRCPPSHRGLRAEPSDTPRPPPACLLPERPEGLGLPGAQGPGQGWRWQAVCPPRLTSTPTPP